MKWSEKPQWVNFLHLTYGDHLDIPIETLDLEEDEIFDHLGKLNTSMLNFAIFEDFFASWFGENGELNVVNDYLKRRGKRESIAVRHYLKKLRDSTVSLYEIIELNPERNMTVRDLLRDGRTLTIQERLGSENSAIWDCIAARVVSVNGKNYFTIPIMHLSRHIAQELVSIVDTMIKEFKKDMLKDLRKQYGKSSAIPPVSREMVLETLPCAQILTHAWMIDTVVKSQAPLPEICNSDGELFIFCEVRFPIQGDQADVIAVLDETAEFQRTDEKYKWDWLEAGDPGYRSARQRKGPLVSESYSESIETDFGNTILGYAELHPKALVLNTNSAERAERGQVLLVSRLGNLVGQSLISYQNVEKALEEPRELVEEESLIMTEDMLEALHSYLDDHYRHTLDNPIPALGNKTPRQAASTKKGRHQVIDWLKLLENMEYRRAAQQGQEPYDTTWIWHELMIDLPR